MKRNYRNETTVDFQGRSETQQGNNQNIGCFILILFAIVIVVMILINTFSK